MTVFFQAANGGDTPLTLGNSLAPEGSNLSSIRVAGGTVSIHGGNTIETKPYTSVNTADLIAGDSLQARTPTGSPRMGQLQPTDVITLGGMDMTVQNAERLGLIERDQHGRYVAVPGGAQQITETASSSEPSDTGEALEDPAVEADLGSLAQGISASTQFALLGQMVNNGELNPNTINRAASELGISPQELSERLGRVVQSFQAQAARSLNAAGIKDAEAFVRWCQENRSREFRSAMHQHGTERSTRGYEPLAREYLSTIAERDPDAVLSAEYGSGITATKHGNTVVLNLPGIGPVDFKTAVREGLITVEGA